MSSKKSMRASIECEKCGKKISKSNYKRHLISCDKLSKIKRKVELKNEWLQPNGMYKCPHCFEEYTKLGISSHMWRKHSQEGLSFKPFKDKTPWNKNLTKFTDERIKKSVETLKLNCNAGYNTKKRIPYYVNGDSNNVVLLQSSYEVRVAENLDENNIKWIRPKPLKWIDNENDWHLYHPDFYLVDYDVYLDPKNDYLIKKDEDKINRVMEYNDVKVFILSKNELDWLSIVKLIE